MELSKVEELLTQLVYQNNELIEKLDNIQCELKYVNEELNWVGETALAKQVVDSLSYINNSINSVEIAVSSLESTILMAQS